MRDIRKFAKFPVFSVILRFVEAKNRKKDYAGLKDRIRLIPEKKENVLPRPRLSNTATGQSAFTAVYT